VPVASENEVGNHGRTKSRSSRPFGFASLRLNSTVSNDQRPIVYAFDPVGQIVGYTSTENRAQRKSVNATRQLFHKSGAAKFSQCCGL